LRRISQHRIPMKKLSVVTATKLFLPFHYRKTNTLYQRKNSSYIEAMK
jgi:hypothetical protein